VALASALIHEPHAAAGDPSAVLVWTIFSVAVFVLACALFGEDFAQTAVVAAGAPEKATGPTERRAHFGGSVGAALRIKDRRVVWRDPELMPQLLLQAAYTTPVEVILWRARRPDWHGRRLLRPSPCRDRSAARRRVVLDRAVG
jgi:hypothetical protein